MSKDSSRESLRESFKLFEACELTRELYASNLPKPDSSFDYVAVQAWVFAPTIYSGIEQALKQIILLKASRDEGNVFDRDELVKVLKGKKYGHNISNLFERLKWCADGCGGTNGCQSTEGCQSHSVFLCAREHIEHHYREHASLWKNHLKEPLHSTAEDFINHISEGGEGYMKWRYLLIEPESVPMLSPWTMLEIWRGACCHIMTHMENTMGGPRSCYSLSSRLNRFFDALWPKIGSEGQEWATWRNANVNPLPSWIAMLEAADRDALHEIDMAPVSRGSLEQTALNAIQQLEELAQLDPSLQPIQQQVERVLEGQRAARHIERPDAQAILHCLRRPDERFAWDSATGGFALRPLPEPRFSTGVTDDDDRSIQASELLVGDPISVPGLGAEPWDVSAHPLGATATLSRGVATCELRDADGGDTPTVDDSQMLLSHLGRSQWVVEKVVAVQRRHLPVRERWIEAVRDGGKERLRVHLRDDQRVLLGDQAEGLSFAFAPARSLRVSHLEALSDAGFEYKVWLRSGVFDSPSNIDAAMSTTGQSLVTVELPGCENPSSAFLSVREALSSLEIDGDSAEFETVNGKHFEVYAQVERSESYHFHRSPPRVDSKYLVGRIGRSDSRDSWASLL